MIPWIIFAKKHKEYVSEAAGPHSIAFKPTLRWHRGSSNPAEPTMSVSSEISQNYYTRSFFSAHPRINPLIIWHYIPMFDDGQT